jgi:hypothetical protein
LRRKPQNPRNDTHAKNGAFESFHGLIPPKYFELL